MEHHQIAKKEAESRKGPWHEEEDETLIAAVSALGERRWDALAKAAGLRRSGKSCRLRWMNYLRPNLKHGHITQQEEHLIIQLHKQWGNRWSRIARSLPGRTDNEIKNYWRSNLRKKALLLQQDAEQTNNNGSTTNDSEQNSMVGITSQDSNASSCSNNGDYAFHGSDDNLRTCGEFSSTVDELNSLGSLAYSSPYETRLMDSTWSNCCKMETFVEDCHPIPGWASGGYSETGLWDTTVLSIWDMD